MIALTLAAALKRFVAESNRIEGITRRPTEAEVAAHETLLALDEITIADLEAFVGVVAPGKPLRRLPGMDVRVGRYIAPPGGPQIEEQLGMLLASARARNAHQVHISYEKLHPFMDGNGRSGRAIWLWMMFRGWDDPYALQRGFLHSFYYQTLAAAS